MMRARRRGAGDAGSCGRQQSYLLSGGGRDGSGADSHGRAAAHCSRQELQKGIRTKARHTLGYLQLCMDIARGRHADVGALQKDFESSRAPLHRLDVQYRIALALRHRGDRTGMEKSREYLLENSGGTCYGELARAL